MTWLFVIALTAHTVLQLWLAARQSAYLKRHARDVPAAFASAISEAAHARSVDYARARLKPSVAATLIGSLLALGWTLGGGLEMLSTALGQALASPLWQGAALIGIVMLVGALVELPLDLWRTFGIEAAFGFNRTTAGRFWLDRLLGLALAFMLGGPLVIAMLWFMGAFRDYWWLLAWALWTVFMLLVSWAFPRLIAPLFNRFTPLEDAQLKARLEGLLERCGFRPEGIFVMDGSRRSAHGNAYFTGLGRAKRIVFFDTLLKQLAPSELEAVLAHELGHFRRRHVQKGLALSVLLSFIGFAALGWLADEPAFYAAFRVSQPGDAVALVLFMILLPLVMSAVQPLLSRMSRRHEFEADAFAAEQASGEDLAKGLVSLYRENASALVADPLYAAYHFSHPAPAERVARIATTSA